MSDLNIRGIPDDLFRKAKVQAAMQGITLKQLVVDVLEKAILEMEGSSKSTRGKKTRKR